MTRTIISSLIILGLSAVAVADDKAAAPPAAGGLDWSKVGPMSRKVTKEDKKGVDALYKSVEVDANTVYLKLFKDIPRQDLEMLLPGSQVKMSAVDHRSI